MFDEINNLTQEKLGISAPSWKYGSHGNLEAAGSTEYNLVLWSSIPLRSDNSLEGRK